MQMQSKLDIPQHPGVWKAPQGRSECRKEPQKRTLMNTWPCVIYMKAKAPGEVRDVESECGPEANVCRQRWEEGSPELTMFGGPRAKLRRGWKHGSEAPSGCIRLQTKRPKLENNKRAESDLLQYELVFKPQYIFLARRFRKPNLANLVFKWHGQYFKTYHEGSLARISLFILFCDWIRDTWVDKPYVRFIELK